MLSAEILKSLPLFGGLPTEQLDAVAQSATVHNFHRGAFILKADQNPDGLYVLLSGRAKVLISHQDEREVILATMGPGDFFGEMGLLDDHPCSASVQAVAASELMHLPTAGLMRCLSEIPQLAVSIMKGLVQRLRHANRQIESLALLDVNRRVLRLLLDLSENVNGKLVVQNAPKKQEMAYMVGASREMVSRVMKGLQNS